MFGYFSYLPGQIYIYLSAWLVGILFFSCSLTNPIVSTLFWLRVTELFQLRNIVSCSYNSKSSNEHSWALPGYALCACLASDRVYSLLVFPSCLTCRKSVVAFGIEYLRESVCIRSVLGCFGQNEMSGFLANCTIPISVTGISWSIVILRMR